MYEILPNIIMESLNSVGVFWLQQERLIDEIRYCRGDSVLKKKSVKREPTTTKEKYTFAQALAT